MGVPDDSISACYEADADHQGHALIHRRRCKRKRVSEGSGSQRVAQRPGRLDASESRPERGLGGALFGGHRAK